MTAFAAPSARHRQAEPTRIDRTALLMMLSYVEAECRRLGAVDAARHTAMAAALLPEVLEGPRGATTSLQ
ncbi:hypothetical protein [Teichococcus vastitatis]|jgi:hypothetical protein|uniref:Uncharacterized protein n=1 Tax=Teichococcus vastitatis TaxID=2307076 RepID=A0ABS9W7F8_9PROT|nr:hypothetical protein [Pseudoroseomonas vastitatis]MCI0754524.1 hypothetical protein [Pseudoroseomonas vastitatis]